MKGVDRVFKLRTSDKKEFLKWSLIIQKNIFESIGQQKNLGIDEKNLSIKAWRYDRINEDEFLKTADIGDILLFRGKHFGAKITRSFSKSHFDHVAMILKFEAETNTVFLLESTTNKGVNIVRWNNFRLWKDEYYENVFYRQLECERSEEFLQTLETFIRSVLGNKYGLSFKNILFARSSIQPPPEAAGPSKKDNKRTFFCSELVAKCYKELGLLKVDTSCGHFLPGSFS
jgi:hypothetical protein